MQNTSPISTVFPAKTAPAGTFDVSPLLKHLSDSSPSDIAVNLETVLDALTTLALDSREDHSYLSTPIHTLRRLRNNLLSGAGVIEFEQ